MKVLSSCRNLTKRVERLLSVSFGCGFSATNMSLEFECCRYDRYSLVNSYLNSILKEIKL
jgi:hypothetical protein